MEETAGERCEPEIAQEKVEVLEKKNEETVELPSSNDSAIDHEINNLTDELGPNLNLAEHEEEIYWQTAEWKSKKHVFVLSSAGKPIYSRYIKLNFSKYIIFPLN